MKKLLCTALLIASVNVSAEGLPDYTKASEFYLTAKINQFDPALAFFTIGALTGIGTCLDPRTEKCLGEEMKGKMSALTLIKRSVKVMEASPTIYAGKPTHYLLLGTIVDLCPKSFPKKK